MNLAFYAPLKAPDHPVPSGDRAMGRMLLRALRSAGHRVHVASRLRSYERDGDLRAQARIRARGRRTAERLVERYRALPLSERPQLWFTYHLYHKAPDWLGPAVSAALDIPYVVAEASHAPKRAGGAWDGGYCAAADAMRQAARIICLNPVDEACVAALLGGDRRLRRLAPFIDARASARRGADWAAAAALRATTGVNGDTPVLVTVAMMREGAKLASYRLLAEALGRLLHRPWQLLTIGDGDARGAVLEALAPLGPRVRHAGRVPSSELPRWLAGCDMHLWPAVDEAWGMAFLEAAAVGVPSVACREGGVSAVVSHGHSGLLVPAGDAPAFAAAAATLLDDPARRAALGVAAARRALEVHDLGVAARALDRILQEAVSP